jgi:hypothetical protein
MAILEQALVDGLAPSFVNTPGGGDLEGRFVLPPALANRTVELSGARYKSDNPEYIKHIDIISDAALWGGIGDTLSATKKAVTAQILGGAACQGCGTGCGILRSSERDIDDKQGLNLWLYPKVTSANVEILGTNKTRRVDTAEINVFVRCNGSEESKMVDRDTENCKRVMAKIAMFAGEEFAVQLDLLKKSQTPAQTQTAA